MTLFDLLNIKIPDLKPIDCKVHLAVCDGEDNPIDVFLSGKFEDV